MYFSVPIEVDSLPMLSEPDLYAFRGYLPEIIEDVMKTIGQSGVDNVRCVMRIIEDRLVATRNLTSIECGAWGAGHGFPKFDKFNNLVGFFWHWDVIHFERGSEAVAEYASKLWEYHNPHSPRRKKVARPALFMESDVRLMQWEKNGQCAFEWSCNGYTVCFVIHGGFFRDYAEWMSCRDSLQAHELRVLEEGVASIASIPSGGWGLVGPADRMYPTAKPQPCPKRHGKYEALNPVGEDPEHKSQSSRYPTAQKPNPYTYCGCDSSSPPIQEGNDRQHDNINPFEHSHKAQESPHRPTTGLSHSDQAGLVDVERGPVHQHASLAAPQSPSRPRYTAKQLDEIETTANHIELFRLTVSLFERSLVNFEEVAREARMQRAAEQRIPTIKESESQHRDPYGPAHECAPPQYKSLGRTEGTLTARESISSPRASYSHHEQRAHPPPTTVNPFASTCHQARSGNEIPVSPSQQPARTIRASSTGTCGDLRGSTTPRYQAYAEDSQEDSPQPRPGSWRDV
ncbi:hypothetical protein DDE82_007616 [Stemphylium lycopersici]|uniref:Uncharacterized protein n=1 Tax=Stemphylium lycopersici TaxID=183478 RepID=A0A364MWP6_STELY|nr:hypothetical protein TW65_01019 [Stemphylium lycopersici]RAR00082.1 hypothetical protein DDE82_007616 [Stemphylium lycopersici]RAR05749.1 hypothetical protein DDE83_007209 [Stemphylium lycopersici]